MAQHQVLLRTQKNELFGIIQKIGLDPTKFDWKEEEVFLIDQRPPQTQIMSKLIYVNSPYFYKFHIEPNLYQPERCPGCRAPVEREAFSPFTWSAVLADFTFWAKRLKIEIDTPDLWTEAQKYQSIFSIPLEDQTQEIPFSHGEAEQIAVALKQVEKRIIEEFRPTRPQIEFIQYKLSYLESRAKRGYPRIDWLNLLMATIISIAMYLALSPEQATQLWQFYKEALSSVVGLAGLLR
jgi:hypothetical protein